MKKTNHINSTTNNIVFISLMLLTLLTWGIGQTDISWKLTFALLLITAFVKIQLIGDFFMQLRTVSSFWRWIITLWILATSTLITIAFYL